jgi:hypothetical protein
MATAAAFFAFLVAALAGVYLSLRCEIRRASAETLHTLQDMSRKRYGYPSGTAEVTPSPAPAPATMGEPVPVPAAPVGSEEEPGPSSSPRPIPLERAAQLSDADIARVDVIAEALGVSRDEAMERIIARGLDVVEEKHGKGPPSGPRKA